MLPDARHQTTRQQRRQTANNSTHTHKPNSSHEALRNKTRTHTQTHKAPVREKKNRKKEHKSKQVKTVIKSPNERMNECMRRVSCCVVLLCFAFRWLPLLLFPKALFFFLAVTASSCVACTQYNTQHNNDTQRKQLLCVGVSGETGRMLL